MEKYGFIYLWYDKKHKRFYVGMHWGTENDGYICSSNWMRDAYKKRPHDFKRKILERIYTNKKELHLKEQNWLSLIKKEELRIKYYNLTNVSIDTWISEEKFNSRKEKISVSTKKAMQRPEVRKKYLEGLKIRNNKPTEEALEKRRISMLGKNKGKITVKDKDGKIFHVTKDDSRWINKEVVSPSKGLKRGPHSKERLQRIKDTTCFKELNKKKVKCKYCDFHGNVGNIARYHDEKCKHKLKEAV